MKHALVLSAALLIAPLTALAEEPKGDMGEGLSLMERGALMFFRGLADDVEPQMKEMLDQMEPALRGLAQEMGPAFAKLADMIGELDDYHAPERLPNGDIILRRKTPLNPDEEEGAVDL